MKCWLNNKCVKPNDCNESCVMYIALNSCIKNSMLPKKYVYPIGLKPIKEDLNAFKRLKEIQDNIQEFVKDGNNLVIYSAGCGNGKTTWASKLMLEYIFTINDGNYMDCRTVFLNVVELLMKVRMIREYNLDNKELKEIICKIQSSDLVIWDEIGVSQLTEFERMFLYNFINERIARNLANIFTSNCTLEVAEEILKTRLYSRIYNNSEQIEFVSNDWRDKNFRKQLGVN